VVFYLTYKAVITTIAANVVAQARVWTSILTNLRIGYSSKPVIFLKHI